MRRLLGVVAALAALTAHAHAAAIQPAVVAPTEPITHAGRWMTDARGRVVIVHGINVPSKTLPAYPAALGFGDADAALQASAGLNAVRLTVERYAVEPSPGTFDDTYVARMADTIALLARHGILSLVDFHQDEYGPVFYDNGFPAWMTLTDGLPNLYQVGFPAQYLLNPALERAYDHFWANDLDQRGHRLQADDTEILSHVARLLAGRPGLLGFEIMNEPWPGSVYPTCIAPAIGCTLFDRGPYSAYYGRAIPALRAADPTHLIWYEPLVTFNYGIPTSMVTPPDAQLGFAFHDYPLACCVEDGLVVSNAVARSAATGAALLETEFGASTNVGTLNQQLAQYDGSMIPWMFWAYNESAAPGVLRALARPYPQLVSGTPGKWSFDPATRVFSFAYTADSFPAGAETDVAVPTLQYPDGYRAVVTGGSVVSAAGAPVLRVAAHAALVTVSVTPGTH